MAQQSWPYAAYNAGAVTDAEYETLAARFSDDGVYGDPADTAVVAAGVGLAVTVRAGVYASVRGHAWYSGTLDVTLTIAANSSGSTRVDRVVLRLDRADWTVTAVVLQGTPGAGRPSLVRDEGATGRFEIPLAEVTVVNGATSVTVERTELYVGARVRPCTSSNRPTVGKRGELAFETDTGKLLVHTDLSGSWETVYEDSGELMLGAGFDTWHDTALAVGRLRNGVVTLRIAKRRLSSPLYKSDSDGSKLAVVPTSLRPSGSYHYFAGQFSTGQSARVEVRSNGEIWVKYPSADVPVSGTLALTMTYVRW